MSFFKKTVTNNNKQWAETTRNSEIVHFILKIEQITESKMMAKWEKPLSQWSWSKREQERHILGIMSKEWSTNITK